jgi:hypothetical protein
MNCPKCHGTGMVPMYQLNHAHVEGALAGRPTQCDYEGCIDGIIHCCDGLQDEMIIPPPTKMCRWCYNKVDAERCFSSFSAEKGAWMCELCGKDVTDRH